VTLPAPPPGHARLKVLASEWVSTDLMARAGDYILAAHRTVHNLAMSSSAKWFDYLKRWLRPDPGGVDSRHTRSP